MLIRLRLFLCSFVPLFLIAEIRFQTPWLVVACGALAIAGMVLGYSVTWAHRKLVPQEVEVERVEDFGSEVAGYLAAYLLPFVTVPEPSLRDVVAYALFIIVAGVIYVRSDMVQINPTLYLAGWTVQQVKLKDGWNGYLLTRRRMRPGIRIASVRIDDKVLLDSEA